MPPPGDTDPFFVDEPSEDADPFFVDAPAPADAEPAAPLDVPLDPNAGTADVPAGMRATGRVRRELQFPEMTGLEGTDVPLPRMVEQRQIEPLPAPEPPPPPPPEQPSAWDRIVGAQFPVQVARTLGSAWRGATGLNPDLSMVDAPEGAPIIGEDRRTQALAAGVGQGMSLGFADESAGLEEGLMRGGGALLGGASPGQAWDVGVSAYERARDAVRRRQDEAEQQAPGAVTAGTMIGALPLGAVLPAPPAASAFGRISQATGLGMGLGTVEGLGRGRGGAEEQLGSAVGGGLIGGVTGGLAQGGGELVRSAMRPAASTAELRAGAAQYLDDAAVPARLEATGVWGPTDRTMVGGGPNVTPAARQANEARFARDVRELGIGHGDPTERRLSRLGERGPTRAPRAERAQADAARVMERAGGQMENVASAAEARVARGAVERPAMPGEMPPGTVDVRNVLARIEEIARRLETDTPAGGAQIATRIRQLVAPLEANAATGMSFRQAHRQRQMLDDLIFSGARSPDPEIATMAGQRLAIRRVLSDEMDDALRRVGTDLAGWWTEANRVYSRAASVGNARGFARLSTGGGMGGAMSAAEGATMLLSGNPLGLAVLAGGRAVTQTQRMMAPGIRARVAEVLADSLRGGIGETALGRFTAPLRAAMERGPTALAAAHYVLSQQFPDYREAIEGLAEEGEEEQTP